MNSSRNGQERVGLVACGALAREVLAIVDANRLTHIETRFLPAKLHNSPKDIPAAVDAVLVELSRTCEHLYVGYADCGTAGALDKVMARHDAQRIEGAHCYAFYAGLSRFDQLQDIEPGTFYLTDFLVRQFDTLVYRPLGLDRHPELLEAYFGNYTRLVFLAQSPDASLDSKALDAATRLGLRYERIETGFGELTPFLRGAA